MRVSIFAPWCLSGVDDYPGGRSAGGRPGIPGSTSAGAHRWTSLLSLGTLLLACAYLGIALWGGWSRYQNSERRPWGGGGRASRFWQAVLFRWRPFVGESHARRRLDGDVA